MSRFIFALLLVFGVGTASAFEIPESLRSTNEHLRKDPSSKARVAAFDTLITRLENISFTPLTVSLREADLGEKSLTLIRSKAKAIVTFEEMLQKRGVENGYALGLSKQLGQLEMATEALGLVSWQGAYSEFGIDWYREPDHTRLFMEQLTSMNKPIVFFVPKAVVTHPKAGVTKNELLWLLQNPERMKNVIFVFGAYDVVTPEMESLREEAGLSTAGLRALVMRALGLASSSYEQEL